MGICQQEPEGIQEPKKYEKLQVSSAGYWCDIQTKSTGLLLQYLCKYMGEWRLQSVNSAIVVLCQDQYEYIPKI